MLFLIFPILALISGFLALFKKNNIALIGSIAIFIVTLVIPIFSYVGNVGTLAELEAFYSSSSSNFQVAQDSTASYLSEEKVGASAALIPIYGSIERMGVGQSAAQRVSEYRDALNSYNKAFSTYKAYSQNALTSLIYPPVPYGMKFLIMNPAK